MEGVELRSSDPALLVGLKAQEKLNMGFRAKQAQSSSSKNKVGVMKDVTNS